MMKKVMMFLLAMVIVVNTIMICSCNNNTKKGFSQYIEKNGTNGLILTIQWIPKNALYPKPPQIEDIKKSSNQITVSGEELSKNIELIELLANTSHKYVQIDESVMAYVYYVFKTEDGSILFEFCDGVYDNDSKEFYVKVNGKNVSKNEIYYAVIKPYLNEKFNEDMNWWLLN